MAVASGNATTRLPLQVVLYFNGWFLALLYVGELCVFVYKGECISDLSVQVLAT